MQLLCWSVPVHVRAKTIEIDAGFINKRMHFTFACESGLVIISNMCCAVFAGMMRVIHVQPGKYETDNNINPCPGSVHIDGLTL